MKQTKKMVVAAAAAVGAVAGGVVALANVPVGAAPEPTAQAVVASSMPSPSDPAEAAERARLEEEIAKAQRKLDRLASASPTAAAVVASGETVTVQGDKATITGTVESAIQNYEIAYRMQSAVPDLVDLRGESEAADARICELESTDLHRMMDPETSSG